MSDDMQRDEGMASFWVRNLPVNFDVRFIANIQPVIIAQMIEGRMVGVVASPDAVEVVLLQQLNVLLHPFNADDLAMIWVVLVPVHPTHNYPAAVQ